MAARQIAAVIQGTTITLVGQDGTRQKGTVDKDGQFQPTEAQ
jgi:hypothetical protein